jgi:isopentenyl diphosphate isomerase/L-lactate dehydrogenase-like FMN-dependent dehydrogenase
LGALGAVGIAHVIKLTRDELEMIMNLSGIAELSDIRPKHTA